MTLPIIRHEHQLTLLVEFLKSKSLTMTWMHSMANSDRKWFWLDGKGEINENDPVIVSAWHSGEPNNLGGTEDHISAHLIDDAKYPSGMYWNDLTGSKHTRPFVCQKRVLELESETEEAIAIDDK